MANDPYSRAGLAYSIAYMRALRDRANREAKVSRILTRHIRQVTHGYAIHQILKGSGLIEAQPPRIEHSSALLPKRLDKRNGW
jgi:hypothetical protein